MESVRRQIEHFDALFDKVLTAEDFAASKPAPDCYLLGAKVFGADIDECVVFEDAYTGLQAGMASGIFTIGITTGHTREELADRCNYVIESYEGLTYEGLVRILGENSV
jgi:beta-phosphoglucomutase-like phosphatase (HAD superfamily)